MEGELKRLKAEETGMSQLIAAVSNFVNAPKIHP
jgi:hypothetical protein